jgi:hypothetical protein
MKRNALIFTWVLGLLLCTQRISAQYYFYDNYAYDTPLMFEFGVSGGFMNCLTDLGGKKGIGKPFLKDLNIGKTQMNAGVYFSALYKNAIGNKIIFEEINHNLGLTFRYEWNSSNIYGFVRKSTIENNIKFYQSNGFQIVKNGKDVYGFRINR